MAAHVDPEPIDDPALRELQRYASVGPSGVYTVAGPLSPGAVPDQIGRGEDVADLLIETGSISPAIGLLIVGGGAAAIAAALYATARQVPVTVLERGRPDNTGDKVSALFGLQAHCTSRRLEPTGYSWPAIGWDVGYFPVDGSYHDMGYEADFANNVANEWRQVVTGLLDAQALSRGTGRLNIVPAVEGLPDDFATVEQGRLFATLASGDRIGPFGAVLMATGSGAERNAVDTGGFTSVRFWDPDKFDKPRLGLKVQPTAVAISGGGDGAIQDTIRCLVKPAFRDIKKLVTALRVPPFVRALVPTSRETGPDDCETFRRLDDECRSAAYRFLAVRDKGAVYELLRDDRPLVHFLFRCNHVHRAYPLNRFVLHLLHLTSPGSDSRASFLQFHGTQGLTKVSCWTHPPGAAAACLGRPHDIQTLGGTQCGVTAESPAHWRWAKHLHVVLIRHGADPDTGHPYAKSKGRRP